MLLIFSSTQQVTIPCSAIFTNFPTDRGMCCAFNMKAADQIFKESKYVKLVQKRQEQDKDKAFEPSKPPSW